MSQLRIVHWNDAYRVTPQKISANGDKIDVTQFASLLDDLRSKWNLREDGTRDGLSLFSGDLFSPSVESTVTRGSHMIPVMNELAPDAALAGNHDFDFGYPQLSKLVVDSKFPWLLSNIIDEETGTAPETLHPFKVLERSGIKIGIIGLVEKDWISTVPAWPSNFKFKDMAETGRELSQKLRGEHQCDLIIALTHSRAPNDIQLAKDLLVLSPSAQETHPIAGEHGVDIILGGHDHFYFVSKGVTTWEGHDISKPCIESEGNNGDILVVKSGTDFKELSELTLELEDTPPCSVRKKVIKAIYGKRHQIQPGMPSSEKLQKILLDVLSSVTESLEAPACITEVELDLQKDTLRTGGTPGGNWFADVLRHAYDDALYTKYGSGSDGVFITAGTLRGGLVYPAGEFTLGDILEILPWDDPVVVLDLDGESLWDTLEHGLSKFPAKEGLFPVISGYRVSWDSRRPPGQRVVGVWLLKEAPSSPANSGMGTPTLVDGEFVKREKSGRKYKIVTRQYLASGYDGYTSLLGHEHLIDDENGQIMSTIIRQYLLGAQYIKTMVSLREKKQGIRSPVAQKWQRVATNALQQSRSQAEYQDTFKISAQEHMGCVDCYDGGKVQRGEVGKSSRQKIHKDDLIAIHPVADGRFTDVAKDQSSA